jgi:hypothetical protein
MMTKAEQLEYLDYLEGRLAAINASAANFVTRSYEPRFVLVNTNVWGPPHPYQDAPPEWDRVFYASIGAATAITFFAAFVSLVKT